MINSISVYIMILFYICKYFIYFTKFENNKIIDSNVMFGCDFNNSELY